ncbi:hypothetical protein SFC66_05230 [Terribacillus saccharophilus]|uniref:hypothetical protein n=1 Tax=Terribacillus saccharophilus TaxID=361277 RepID=UPI0039827789
MWMKLGVIMCIIAFLQLFTLQVIAQFVFIPELLYLYPLIGALFGAFCFAMLYLLKEKGS